MVRISTFCQQADLRMNYNSVEFISCWNNTELRACNCRAYKIAVIKIIFSGWSTTIIERNMAQMTEDQYLHILDI